MLQQLYPSVIDQKQYNILNCNKTENPRVGGSIPPLGTIQINDLLIDTQAILLV